MKYSRCFLKFKYIYFFNNIKIKTMFKNIILISFLIVSIIIIYVNLTNCFGLNIQYYLSILLLIIAVFVYPTNFKFEHKIDFMIFPVFALLIFDFVNLIFIKDLFPKIATFNYVLSAYCFLQFAFEKYLIMK